MQTYAMNEFLGRSTDKPWSETTLAKILTGLPMLTFEGPWIAGGAVRRTLLAQEPDSDFDFFFRDADQLERFRVALEGLGFSLFRESEHHLHYRGYIEGDPLMRDVQLIRFQFYRGAADVIDDAIGSGRDPFRRPAPLDFRLRIQPCQDDRRQQFIGMEATGMGDEKVGNHADICLVHCGMV